MPRPRRLRRIHAEPNITYFKPAGIRMTELEDSVLTVDEFEAVRLKDLQQMDQEEAAKKMNISQPTFHRLVLTARKKVADAIVNGKAIKIQGGNFKIIKQPRIMGYGGPFGTCNCPSCGYKESKKRSIPCNTLSCPKCNSILVRGN